ncbi:MAG: TlpA family protein disulfide reductase [Firmicutes bacterium]|nr:TlpA family protein disulfide reductase [Bacillota bacterium]
MKKARLLVIALVFVLLLGGAYFLYGQYGGTSAPTIDYTEEQGQAESSEAVAAPDFTVLDAGEKEVSLSSFLGRPIVLNFWASWCPPCRSEMPDFEEMYLEYGDEVTFMMVNLTDGSRETVEIASAFITEQGYTFPVYYDIYMEGAYSYQVSSVPATYFIDADGNVVAHAIGALNKDSLRQGIEMIK